jgi:hypothetical protein
MGESTSMRCGHISSSSGVLDTVVSEGNRLLECAFEVTNHEVAITA